MKCRVCGLDGDEPICEECVGLGFVVGTHGEVLCPTCGEDFEACGCSAPDCAYM